MITLECINYIKNFLTDGNNGDRYIHYGKPNESNKPVIIVESDFFKSEFYGTEHLIPTIPLKQLEYELPILFGEAVIERKKNQVVIYADLIASSFFLLSRYDEAFCNIERDKYARPIGKTSFKAKASILNRPLVDEYREYILTELQRLGYNIKIKRKLNHIYMTHDVDHPWKNYTKIDALKTCIKDFLIYHRINLSPICNAMGNYKRNNCDTFDWLFEQDAKIKTVYGQKADDVYFFIGLNTSSSTMTMRYWDDPKALKYVERIQKHASICGVHASYEAGVQGELLKKEKENVETILGRSVHCNRNHFLMSVSVDWLTYLEKENITEDFTMGYADCIGFRLSTCRSVKWIDPMTFDVHDLILHPLSVMDSTIIEPQYLGLERDEGISYIKNIIDIYEKYNGDFSFLLHNDVPADARYCWCKKGYEEVIEYLCTLL